MVYLKQSTAVTLLFGPFLDETDGKTAETALTITQADVRISKNGANIIQKSSVTSLTHDELGYYTCPLDTTDTNTLGILRIMVQETGALPVWVDCSVVTANWYDTMFSTDQLDVNTTAISGTAQTANDVGADVDAILIDTNSLNDTKIPDTISLANINAEADTALTDYDPPTRLESTTDKDAIITEVNANETKIDTMDTVVDGIQTDLSNATDGLGALKSVIDAILVDTGEIGTAGAGLTNITINAQSVTDIWAKAMQDLATGAPSVSASVLTAINYLYEAWRNKTTTTAILHTIKRDDGTTDLTKATVGDDGTTFTKDEYVTG